MWNSARLGVGMWKLKDYQSSSNGPGRLIALRDIVSHVVLEEGVVQGQPCWISVSVNQVNYFAFFYTIQRTIAFIIFVHAGSESRLA